jgi:hypothetical protein
MFKFEKNLFLIFDEKGPQIKFLVEMLTTSQNKSISRLVVLLNYSSKVLVDQIDSQNLAFKVAKSRPSVISTCTYIIFIKHLGRGYNREMHLLKVCIEYSCYFYLF